MAKIKDFSDFCNKMADTTNASNLNDDMFFKIFKKAYNRSPDPKELYQYYNTLYTKYPNLTDKQHKLK